MKRQGGRGRREPVNLVWWLLTGGILLGVLVDNPLQWDAELLRERERQGLQSHSPPEHARPTSPLLFHHPAPATTTHITRNQHVQTRPAQTLLSWHSGATLTKRARRQ